jgi:hypothetical protein
MREFRKKQKRLKKIMNTLVVFTAIYFFVYIGIEPMLAAWSNTVALVAGYVADGLVFVVLCVLFAYFSRYGKSDKFLESIEYELSDVGYYLTSRTEKDCDSYYQAVVSDIRNKNYSVNEKVEVNDFEFDAIGSKGNELFYIVNIDELEKNDVIAYIDSAIYDITAIKVKRRANAVVLFICDNADDGAVSLSKAINTLGKKETVKVAVAIAEMSTSRVYFLGNRVTKCQQMIANYVMNCEVPIKEEYKAKEQLPFQFELEEHMKEFNIKDFKNGTFYAH